MIKLSKSLIKYYQMKKKKIFLKPPIKKDDRYYVKNISNIQIMTHQDKIISHKTM